MGKLVWISLMVILSLLICCEQCSIEMCFSWKVSLNNLTLICKVNSWNHRVYIHNQFGSAVLDCIPTDCKPYHKNASIIRPLTTNEITYSVQGMIDNKLNGNWTCRHGTNLDIARVEVTVLKDERNLGDQVINVLDSRTEILICYTVVGFVGMIAVCAISRLIKNINCKDKTCCCRSACKEKFTPDRDLQKKAIIGIVVILLLLFGIPVLVGVREKETHDNTAIAAMFVLGMTLGGTIGIFFFCKKKIRNDPHSSFAVDEEPINEEDAV